MRLQYVFLVLVAVSIGAVAGPVRSDRRVPMGDAPAPLVTDEALGRAGLSSYWQARLPLSAGDSIREAFLVDAALYVTTTNGQLFSLQADVGLLRWGLDLTAPDYTIFRPTHARTADGAGPAVVPTTTKTVVLDRYKGTVLTEFAPPFVVGGPALALGSAMFAGSPDGRLYAMLFDADDRRRAIKLWEVMAGGPVTAGPVLVGREQLVFATHGGVVFSCLASDKTLLWHYRTDGAVTGDLAADASGVYAASGDRSLYKLDPGTGRPIWRVRFPRPLAEGPVVTDNAVYQYCPRIGLTALDPRTGKQKWNEPSGRRLASSGPGGGVLFSSDQKLLVVDSETGKRRHVLDVPHVADVVPNPAGSAVYLIGRGSRLMSVRLDDAPYLRRQQVQAARQRLNLPPAAGASPVAPPLTPVKAEEPDAASRDPLRSRRDRPPQ